MHDTKIKETCGKEERKNYVEKLNKDEQKPYKLGQVYP